MKRLSTRLALVALPFLGSACSENWNESLHDMDVVEEMGEIEGKLLSQIDAGEDGEIRDEAIAIYSAIGEENEVNGNYIQAIKYYKKAGRPFDVERCTNSYLSEIEEDPSRWAKLNLLYRVLEDWDRSEYYRNWASFEFYIEHIKTEANHLRSYSQKLEESEFMTAENREHLLEKYSEIAALAESSGLNANAIYFYEMAGEKPSKELYLEAGRAELRLYYRSPLAEEFLKKAGLSKGEIRELQRSTEEAHHTYFRRAAERSERDLDQRKTSSELRKVNGNDSFEAGEYEDAIRHYRAAEDWPKMRSTYAALGDEQVANGENCKARLSYDKAREGSKESESMRICADEMHEADFGSSLISYRQLGEDEIADEIELTLAENAFDEGNLSSAQIYFERLGDDERASEIADMRLADALSDGEYCEAASQCSGSNSPKGCYDRWEYEMACAGELLDLVGDDNYQTESLMENALDQFDGAKEILIERGAASNDSRLFEINRRKQLALESLVLWDMDHQGDWYQADCFSDSAASLMRDLNFNNWDHVRAQYFCVDRWGQDYMENQPWMAYKLFREAGEEWNETGHDGYAQYAHLQAILALYKHCRSTDEQEACGNDYRTADAYIQLADSL